MHIPRRGVPPPGARPQVGGVALPALLLVACLCSFRPSAGARKGASFRSSTERVVFKLLNDIRREHKLPPFTIQLALRSAAREHSADMLARQYFEHDSPNETFDHRIRRHLDSSLVGENIAWGTGRYATPQGLVKLWMTLADPSAHHPHARPPPAGARRRHRHVRRQQCRRHGDCRLRRLSTGLSQP